MYTRSIVGWMVIASFVAACGSNRDEESCKVVDEAFRKAERLVAESLAAQGLHEPALLDGHPNPAAFTADGAALQGPRWRELRDELIAADIYYYTCRKQSAPKAPSPGKPNDWATYDRLLAKWKIVKRD